MDGEREDRTVKGRLKMVLKLPGGLSRSLKGCSIQPTRAGGWFPARTVFEEEEGHQTQKPSVIQRKHGRQYRPLMLRWHFIGS